MQSQLMKSILLTIQWDSVYVTLSNIYVYWNYCIYANDSPKGTPLPDQI